MEKQKVRVLSYMGLEGEDKDGNKVDVRYQFASAPIGPQDEDKWVLMRTAHRKGDGKPVDQSHVLAVFLSEEDMREFVTVFDIVAQNGASELALPGADNIVDLSTVVGSPA